MRDFWLGSVSFASSVSRGMSCRLCGVLYSLDVVL